jgi:hypothetical protein
MLLLPVVLDQFFFQHHVTPPSYTQLTLLPASGSALPQHHFPVSVVDVPPGLYFDSDVTSLEENTVLFV